MASTIRIGCKWIGGVLAVLAAILLNACATHAQPPQPLACKDATNVQAVTVGLLRIPATGRLIRLTGIKAMPLESERGKEENEALSNLLQADTLYFRSNDPSKPRKKKAKKIEALTRICSAGSRDDPEEAATDLGAVLVLKVLAVQDLNKGDAQDGALTKTVTTSKEDELKTHYIEIARSLTVWGAIFAALIAAAANVFLNSRQRNDARSALYKSLEAEMVAIRERFSKVREKLTEIGKQLREGEPPSELGISMPPMDANIYKGSASAIGSLGDEIAMNVVTFYTSADSASAIIRRLLDKATIDSVRADSYLNFIKDCIGYIESMNRAMVSQTSEKGSGEKTERFEIRGGPTKNTYGTLFWMLCLLILSFIVAAACYLRIVL